MNNCLLFTEDEHHFIWTLLKYLSSSDSVGSIVYSSFRFDRFLINQTFKKLKVIKFDIILHIIPIINGNTTVRLSNVVEP